jgi:hypothetical protein
LHAIRPHLDLRVFADARDWCAALFAFFGLLRVKEYTCSGLLREHVSVHPWGISLAIPFSKTSLIPAAVAIIRRDDGLCPVAAHRAYTSLLPARLRKAAVPYFLHDDSTTAPLTDLTFIRHVRRWVRDLLHASPAQYSGHSFRRGGTTALQMAGVPESTIASHGRWKSLAYRSYFDVQFNFASRPPLSSACTMPVAWARSRRFRQARPSSVSLLFFSFLWPFNSLFSRLVAALPAVVGDADHSHGQSCYQG